MEIKITHSVFTKAVSIIAVIFSVIFAVLSRFELPINAVTIIICFSLYFRSHYFIKVLKIDIETKTCTLYYNLLKYSFVKYTVSFTHFELKKEFSNDMEGSSFMIYIFNNEKIEFSLDSEMTEKEFIFLVKRMKKFLNCKQDNYVQELLH